MKKIKPKIVFLDTDQFYSNKLYFAHQMFLRLADLVANGFAKVLLTEVVDREVRRHIFKELQRAKLNLEKSVAKGLFQNIEGGASPTPLSSEYWDGAAKEITAKYVVCCNLLKVEILPLNYDFTKKVFDWYFAGDAPFDTEKRKAEFPDAFSIACVDDWATKRVEHVYILSKDEAFQCVKRNDLLTKLDSLAAFLELFPNPKVSEAIKVSFISFLEEEDNSSFGESEFQQLCFYVEDEGGYEVEGVFVLYTEPNRLHVIEASDGKAVISGSLFVHFMAQVGKSDVEEMALVDAEIAITYDVKQPDQIKPQSIKFESKWGIGVSAPHAHRRDYE